MYAVRHRYTFLFDANNTYPVERKCNVCQLIDPVHFPVFDHVELKPICICQDCFIAQEAADLKKKQVLDVL